MEPYLKHEEGLAVINQMLPSALKRQSKPYFYMAALHYISAILSSQMSFAQLFYELRYFIQDESKRYRECLRVKRGMRDTSQPGGMYKVEMVWRIGSSVPEGSNKDPEDAVEVELRELSLRQADSEGLPPTDGNESDKHEKHVPSPLPVGHGAVPKRTGCTGLV